MDREEVCESLITWLKTFEIDVPHETPDDLTPDYFNEGWMSKVQTDEVTNWRLKVSNLKKILKGILEYNLEVLGIQIQDFQMPDVNSIESVQHVVMNAIQELKRTVEDLNNALEAKEELTERCHELDQQVATLSEEKQSLAVENEKLNESTPAGKRYQQLQQMVENIQEENYKLETARDDFRIKYEVLAKDFAELKQKNGELGIMAEEARSLKDELDVLRHTSEQVAKYEATIESYKKKLEKNTKYMQQQLELEEELRKSGTLKQQLEHYKRQVHELQNKISEETKRADKADFECKRSQEKMTTIQREKERICLERDTLREMNEELKCTQLETQKSGTSDLDQSQDVDMLSLSPAVKEKLLRLEHENKMLKLKTTGSEDDQVNMLQSMLDDSDARKNELETDMRIANQRIMELEAQVEDLQENQKTVSNDELVEMRKKLQEQIQKTQAKDSSLQKEKDKVEEIETKLSASNDKIQELQEKIVKMDDEKKLMEARFKKQFEKAKQRESEKAKSLREQEERLLVSAFNNLGLQLHRQASEDRLANSSSGQSFLARQRQVHTSRRTQSIPNSHSNPSRNI
ncbi:hypothetical protein KUTeg_016643 [Tegillarca granosa]|uniref:Uncharacterized protein n=1 Tax=Tegillarca granosa TaxID=220873 RepID=A0ABQ9ELG8_TEGGR|nr:hypothetical protein KUTeg_016643 [Tegillarca granosa]